MPSLPCFMMLTRTATKWIFVLLLAVVHCASIAQVSDEEKIRDLQRKQQSIEFEQSQLRLQQMRLESDRLRFETERLEQLGGDRRRQPSAIDVFREMNEEKAKDEEAAAVTTAELRQQALRTAQERNGYFMAAAFAGLIAAVGFVAISKKRSNPMSYDEKFGLLVVMGAFLLALLAMLVSDGWVSHLDVLNNLMLTMRLRFIESDTPSTYLIDIPTKYCVLVSAFLAAYGIAVYAGLLPVRSSKTKVEK